MKHLIFYLCIGLSVLACRQSGHAQDSELLDPKAFQKKIQETEEMYLIDVRRPEEQSNGLLQEAQLINFFEHDFKEKLGALDKQKIVMVYCASGGRSAKTVAILKSFGFTQVYELKGGIKAWKTQGLPVSYPQ